MLFDTEYKKRLHPKFYPQGVVMKKDFFVGADISKNTIDICFLTSVETKKPLYVSLPNDYETIKAYFKSFIKDNITIVFE